MKNENIAEYGHFKRITDEHILEKIRSIDEDSNSLTPETLFEILTLLKMDISYKDICELNQ